MLLSSKCLLWLYLTFKKLNMWNILKQVPTEQTFNNHTEILEYICKYGEKLSKKYFDKKFTHVPSWKRTARQVVSMAEDRHTFMFYKKFVYIARASATRNRTGLPGWNFLELVSTTWRTHDSGHNKGRTLIKGVLYRQFCRSNIVFVRLSKIIWLLVLICSPNTCR